jgi:prepilin-type processing-associated H-X9-DG protein
MTWGAGSSVDDRSNTNTEWVVDGVLGKYTAGAVGAYKCPADNYLAPGQARAGWSRRNRSLSMNSVFGRFSTGVDDTLKGLNWGFPQYKQYLKQVQVPRPAKTWLMLDEQPDSINDGYFINNPDSNNWSDLPSSYHNGACGFSFADGHSEIKKWRSATSMYPAGKYVYPAQKSFDAAGKLDYKWYLERTGYLLAKNDQPMFNY